MYFCQGLRGGGGLPDKSTASEVAFVVSPRMYFRTFYDSPAVIRGACKARPLTPGGFISRLGMFRMLARLLARRVSDFQYGQLHLWNPQHCCWQAIRKEGPGSTCNTLVVVVKSGPRRFVDGGDG